MLSASSTIPIRARQRRCSIARFRDHATAPQRRRRRNVRRRGYHAPQCVDLRARKGHRAIGPAAALPQTADVTIDARGTILIPGLVNTHHHFYQTLTRTVPGTQDVELFVARAPVSDLGAPDARRDARRDRRRDGGIDALGMHDGQRSHLSVAQRLPHRRSDRSRARDRAALPRLARLDVGGQSKGGLPPDSVVEDEEAILRRYATRDRDTITMPRASR